MFGSFSAVLRFIVGATWMAFCSTILIIVTLLLLPFRIARIKACNFYGKVLGRSITFLAGVTPRFSNREAIDQAMPAIYVMNHTSALDVFTGIWMCPYGGCGVFKKEIVRVPFLGWLAALSGHLLIDRGNTGRAVEVLKETAIFVKKHRLGIWIFPEGTRSKDGRLLPFKKGFVHLAIATGFPVVPVIVHGAHRNWEKGSFRFIPTVVDIEVLPPIDTSAWKEETSGEHAAAVHDLVAARLRDDQKPAVLPAGSLIPLAG
jgi:1-acyl-sn-glycerol-3-phosphate acyltransferase